MNIVWVVGEFSVTWTSSVPTSHLHIHHPPRGAVALLDEFSVYHFLKAFVFPAPGRGHKHSSRCKTINHWKGRGRCTVTWTVSAMCTVLNEGNQTLESVYIGPPLSVADDNEEQPLRGTAFAAWRAGLTDWKSQSHRRALRMTGIAGSSAVFLSEKHNVCLLFLLLTACGFCKRVGHRWHQLC